MIQELPDVHVPTERQLVVPDVAPLQNVNNHFDTILVDLLEKDDGPRLLRSRFAQLSLIVLLRGLFLSPMLLLGSGTPRFQDAMRISRPRGGAEACGWVISSSSALNFFGAGCIKETAHDTKTLT